MGGTQFSAEGTTGEQHRDSTGHAVLLAADGADECRDCPWLAIQASPDSARPVEDREANQARVHQEAHEPTADWIDLADDPDAPPMAAEDAANDLIISRLRRGAYDRGFTAGHAIGRVEGEAQAIELYPPHWGFDAIEAERRHRERMAAVQAETEARALAHMVNYPTDYEIWRDAWQLAVGRLGNAADREELAESAKWFHLQLQQAPAQDVPDDDLCGCKEAGTEFNGSPVRHPAHDVVCPDCQGADGNHFTGCSVAG